MRTTTPSDAVLVRRSLRHPEEFEVLFERHGATVLRYLQLRVGHSLAEELMAETFVRAFDARRRFDSRRASALPWLYGIASNLIRMHFRTKERRLRAYRAAAGLETQPGDLTAESVERLHASELAPAIAAALAALPVAQSDVLRRPDDPRELLTYQGEMVGKTDRFVMVFRQRPAAPAAGPKHRRH